MAQATTLVQKIEQMQHLLQKAKKLSNDVQEAKEEASTDSPDDLLKQL